LLALITSLRPHDLFIGILLVVFLFVCDLDNKLARRIQDQ